MFAIVLARLWACSNALGVTDYKPLSLVSFIASPFLQILRQMKKYKDDVTVMSVLQLIIR